MQRTLVLALLAGCFHGLGMGTASVLAQAAPRDPAPGVMEPEERLTLPPQIELSRLVDLVASRTGINVDYDPSLLPAQPVALRMGGPVSNRELWDLLNRLLGARGLATVQVPGKQSYAVVRLGDAPGQAALDLRKADAGQFPQPEFEPGFQMALVRIKHRLPKDVVDIVDKLLAKPAGTITALGDSDLVLISESSPRLAPVLNLIDRLDRETAVEVKEVDVTNARSGAIAALAMQVAGRRDALSGHKTRGEVVAMLDQPRVLVIAPSDAMDSWTKLVAELDRREQVETVLYSPRSFGPAEVARLLEGTVRPPGGASDDRWRVVVEELTGSLLITATPAQHDRIRQTLERLERTPGATSRPVRSFVIKNRPATEVQTILEDLNRAGALRIDTEPQSASSGISPAAGSATTANPSSAAATPASIPPTAGASAIPPAQPRLTPPGAVSAGSAVSTPSSPPTASAIPGRPRPDASTLSVTVDASTNTLIVMAEPRTMAQIESLLPTLDVRQAQVSLEVLIVSLTDNQTLDLGVELEKLTRSGDTRIRLSSLFGIGSRGSGGDRTVGDGSGFTAFVLNPGDFSIVLRALETINQGRSMSMPRLLVTNNQQATLDSTLDQPFTTTSQPTSGGVLTSFGGSSQAGTQVTLKPQIAEGDHLRLDYSVSLSAFVGASAGPNVPPPKQQNKIASAATLPDGYTVAVGGIEVTTDGTGLSQVPGVGRIPIIGEAFKNRSKTQGRSRFYVFIRANILRHRGFEDLKYLSDRQSTAAQIDDGFPDLAPRVIR